MDNNLRNELLKTFLEMLPRGWFICFGQSEVGSVGEFDHTSQICSPVLLQKSTAGKESEDESVTVGNLWKMNN